MNKVKFKFEENKPISIGTYDGNEVLVIPYIPYEAQLSLVSQYLSTYFYSESNETSDKFLSEYNYFGAEYELMMNIVDDFTNIMVFGSGEEPIFDSDGFLSSGLWEDIKASIRNYDDLISMIYIVVSSVKEEKYQKNSFREALNEATKIITEFVEGLSNIEMTEEGFKGIIKQISEVGETLKDSPLSSIIEDSKRK